MTKLNRFNFILAGSLIAFSFLTINCETATPPDSGTVPPIPPVTTIYPTDSGNIETGTEDSSIETSTSCIPTTCVNAVAQCGYIADGCGGVLNCGSCATNESCNNNLCQLLPCIPNTCSPNQCGVISDGCNGVLNCNCQTAGSICVANTNSCCVPETDPTFCTRLGRTCGSETAADNCGTLRTVTSCGAACLSPQICATTTGTCCTPETDAALCLAAGKNCGSIVAVDNCGVERTVADCGDGCVVHPSPTPIATCGGGGTPNVCGCTPLAACPTGVCGEIPVGCGDTLHTLDCSNNCLPTQTECHLTGNVTVLNQCCVPETDLAFCARLNITCGSETAPDNCGVERTGIACGSCTAPKVCMAGSCH